MTWNAWFDRVERVKVAQQILSVFKFAVIRKVPMSIGLLLILLFDLILQLSTFAKVSNV